MHHPHPRQCRRLRRPNSRRPHRQQRAGSWGIIFTVLLLAVGLCGMTGCRKKTPPPPTPGWVRLDALTSMHPSRPMLADLDRRLEGLRLQREHVLAQPALSIPPDAAGQRMPALPKLPEPALAANPAPPTERLNVQAKEAFRRSLAHELERKVARDERLLRDKAAIDLQQELAHLALQADANRNAIAEQYKLPLLRGALQSEMAREQIKQAERQLLIAGQSFDTATEQATMHPTDTKAASEVTRAAAVRDAAARHFHNTQKKADAITEAYHAERTAYLKAREGVDVWLDAALLHARQQHTGKVAERVKALRQEMHDALEQGVAAREARLAADAPHDTPSAPVEPLPFTALPDDALVLPAPGLDGGFRAAQDNATGRRAAMLQGIDRTIESVQRERRALLSEIERDTRAAVIAVSSHHGYAVTFARGNGEEITVQARRWLREYWPSVP